MKTYLICLLLCAGVCTAQTYTASTLVSLPPASQKSAMNPFAPVVDTAGNVYATSENGGAHGEGTVFKVAPTGKITILYSFGANPTDGTFPGVSLVRDNTGNLYGVTITGGTLGFGIVFKLTSAGKETVLHNFSYYGGSSLARDSSGNLYGYESLGNGSLFKLTPSGVYSTLYSFCSQTNCTDGFQPSGGPIVKSDGSIYGTAAGGDFDLSVVFKVTAQGVETVLHSFAGGPDGENAGTRLTQDNAGNLYGTAGGGDFSNGIVFKVDSSGNYSVLYSFCALANCADGSFPRGPVVLDTAGNIYGVTEEGGLDTFAYGVAYKISPTGIESVLYDAPGAAGSGAPGLGTALAIDSKGNLYGSTWNGGAAHNGSVYKLTKH